VQQHVLDDRVRALAVLDHLFQVAFQEFTDFIQFLSPAGLVERGVLMQSCRWSGPKNTGGPSGGSFWGDVLKGAEIFGAAALVTAAALWGGG
jgi:hypothetical protein